MDIKKISLQPQSKVIKKGAGPLKEKPLKETKDAFVRQGGTDDAGFMTKPDIKSEKTAEAVIEKAEENSVENYSFQVVGAKEGGFYKEIKGNYKGEKVSLKMERKTNIFNAGGFYVEGDPTYNIKGNFAGVSLDLKVDNESQVVSGIEMGNIYHVNGKIGNRELKADITHESQVSGFIQTGVFAHLEGNDTDLSVKGVSVTEDVGGFHVETDNYDHISGKDGDKEVDAKLRGMTSGHNVSVEGNLPKETMALVLGLKPFLYAA